MSLILSQHLNGCFQYIVLKSSVSATSSKISVSVTNLHFSDTRGYKKYHGLMAENLTLAQRLESNRVSVSIQLWLKFIFL